MLVAIEEAARVEGTTSPNPWVGCVLWGDEGEISRGATRPPGGPHAEVVALGLAGQKARGATLFVTLEPCSHQGRTPPCVDAIVEAGVAKVVVAVEDPDPLVAGSGLAMLREAGVEVEVGEHAAEVVAQLAPYVKHRTTGRPWVVLKLGMTADGRIAAPDGSSRWITGPEAREDAHRLRAVSDAILVGAGTVRRDDPALTVRHGQETTGREPLRIVLGAIPPEARLQEARQMTGDPGDILGTLGSEGVVRVLVEGGAAVAHSFHARGLVDRYVLYVAPALFGGDDARSLFSGPGAGTIADIWRGRFLSVERLGEDLRIELAPRPPE